MRREEGQENDMRRGGRRSTMGRGTMRYREGEGQEENANTPSQTQKQSLWENRREFEEWGAARLQFYDLQPQGTKELV